MFPALVRSRHPFAALALAALAMSVTACGSAPARPAVTEAKVEGRRIEGITLSPGIAELAKEEGEVKLTEDDRVKCEKYMPLGSHRVRYRCVTLAEDQLSKDKNNREIRKMQTPPPSAGARSIGALGN